MSVAISENALKVLKARYFTKDENGNVIEDAKGMFTRVARAVAKADLLYDENANVMATQQEFYELMTSFRFLPNSPTLMNAGKPLGQLSACFVLPVSDSMEEIFESVKQAALIHKSGGGTGFSFSRLRQNGARVNTTGGVASGPVSFMKVFNAATEAVKQGGTRRGANMGILRVDHPDIQEFIHCKANNADITNFNISIGITEVFMQSALNGSDYDLIDPSTKAVVGKMNARKIFEEIVNAAHKNGEPGIIFLDRLNRDNIVPSKGEIESTNPCGEQPLLPYESCNLGSINLVKVLRASENGCEIDYSLLKSTVHSAVHFLDNVIDVNNYPLKRIEEVTKETRKIGLGVMGFADMLLYLGVPYNSEEAIELAESIMSFISIEGQNASRKIARMRGAFPLFFESTYANKAPIRNGTVTTIAPTGTISMIASCSSGVEPNFAYVYIRNVMDGTEMIEVNPVLKQVLKQRALYSEELMRKIAKQGSLAHIDEIPQDIKDVFVCSHDISAHSHIKMQAAFQHYTDNAVSKTINLSNSAGKKQVAECYVLAYRLGCKGVTIYRDGSRAEQVLNIGSVNKKEGEVQKTEQEIAEKQGASIQTDIQPRKRPAVTMGFTERMKIGCGNLYVTVNYDKHGICEIFTSTGKAGGCPSQSEATARLASIALRSGVSMQEVYHQLKGIRCPSTVRRGGMSCTSCPDAIAKVIIKADSFIKNNENASNNFPEPEKTLPDHKTIKMEIKGESEPAENTAESKAQSDIAAEQKPQSEKAENVVIKASDITRVSEAKAAKVHMQKQEAQAVDQAPYYEQSEPQVGTQDVFQNENAYNVNEDVRSEDNISSYVDNIKNAIYSATNDSEQAFIGDESENNLKAEPYFEEQYAQSENQEPKKDFTPFFEEAWQEDKVEKKDLGSVSVPPENLNLPETNSFKEYISNNEEFVPLADELEAQRLVAVPVLSNSSCPECEGALEHEGGCVICRNCGYSKCG